jgi:hypothetical protein
MGNSETSIALRAAVLFAIAFTAASTVASAAPKQGSHTLCAVIGPRVVAADANLAQAAQIAVALGTDDAEVLSGTHARYGGAFKVVEDDQKLLPGLFHSGMSEVTMVRLRPTAS